MIIGNLIHIGNYSSSQGGEAPKAFLSWDGNYGNTTRMGILNGGVGTLPNNILRLQNGVNFAQYVGINGATVTAPGNGYLRCVSTNTVGLTQIANVRLAAGTYTLSFDAKSRDGSSSYTIYTGINGNLSQITVTPDEQTFSKSFSVGSLSNVSLFVLYRNTDGDAYDIYIRNIRLHYGSSDLGLDTPAGHLMIGKSDHDAGNFFTDGAFKNEGIAHMPDGSKTFTEFTIVASINQVSNTTGSSAIILGEDYTKLSVASKNNCLNGRLSIAEQQSEYGRVRNLGWITVTFRVRSNLQELFVNSILVDRKTNSFTSYSVPALYTGALGGGLGISELGSNDRIQSIDVYDKFLTDEELTQAIGGLRTRLSTAGLTPGTIPYSYVACGDSLTFHSDSYARRMFNNNATLVGQLLAVNSTGISHALTTISNYSSALQLQEQDGTVPIVSLLTGVNDSMVASDPTGYFALLVQFYDAVRALGGKVLAITLSPKGNDGGVHNAGRAIVNGLLRDNPSVYDALADLDESPAAADEAPGGEYFSDFAHWNSAGYDEITPIIQQAFDDIVNSL